MIGKLYILGHPVAHSLSPAMHNAAYRALGLDWDYGFADCETADQAQKFLDGRNWLALNITMPYKPLAFAAADHASREAILANGANVLVNWQGELHADNTDGKGCVAYLQRCGVSFEGASVAVCGTGPTSLAIMHAASAAGARQVALFGRDEARTQRIVDGFGDGSYRACSYKDDLSVLAASQIIIDATPLGMKADDPAPFDTTVLSSEQTVFDVVYGHGTTALIAAAQDAGCAAFDGKGMLVAQAVETVYDIARITGVFEIPSDCDLFEIMTAAIRE